MEIGDRFGRLVLIKDLGMVEYGSQGRFAHWGLFRCNCGNEKKIRIGHVSRGSVVACGCYQRQMAKEGQLKHGLSEDKIYKLWKGIKARCNNQNTKSYKNYGGRGVKLCDEWCDFMNFYNWVILNGYRDGLKIDRINNDGDYEPSNCAFVTNAENCAIGKTRKRTNNTSGFVGVYRKGSKWAVQISPQGKKFYLGAFDNLCDAVECRIQAEIELFGEQKTNLNYDRNNFKKD